MSFNTPPTTANLLISLENIGNYFERKYYKNLIFPKPGIYKVGDTHPILLSGCRYFYTNINDPTNTRKVLEDINSLVQGDYIVDLNGNVLLNTREVDNRNTYLSDRPTVPTVGFDLIKYFVEYHITNKNIYTNESRNIKYSIIKKIMGDDAEDIFDELIHDEHLISIFNRIDHFIGKDVYYIYFLKRTGLSDLLIEKTIDWRAYQWELSKNSEENGTNFN